MSIGLRIAAVSLALTLGLPACSFAAYAMPQNAANAQAKHSIISDISDAQYAMSRGRLIAALNDTENAETTLRNAQQAGDLQYSNMQAVDALAWADSDLESGWNAAAAVELHTAITDLG